jgi:hypothetical protein
MLADRDFHSNWSKTSEYLRDARAHLSETAEDVCANEIAEFEEFLTHNELELALAIRMAGFRRIGGPLRVGLSRSRANARAEPALTGVGHLRPDSEVVLRPIVRPTTRPIAVRNPSYTSEVVPDASNPALRDGLGTACGSGHTGDVGNVPPHICRPSPDT